MVAVKRKKSSTKGGMSPAKVRELAKECLESRGKLNNIVTLLELCENDNEEVAYAAFISMGHVYAKLLERGDMKRKKGGEKEDDLKAKIAKWLRENRAIYVQLAFDYLSHAEPAMQVAALESLMSVVKDQSYQSKDFYNDLFQQMVEKCVTNDQMSDLLLERLVKELNDFDDVRYYFYKDFAKYLGEVTNDVSGKVAGIKTSAKRRRSSLPSDKLSILVNTGYSILSRIRDPITEDDQLETFLYESDAAPSKKNAPASAKEHKRVFSDCWLAFMRNPMSADLHKRILLAMHKKIIPFLSKPTLLIDFLVDSYDQGGAVSMLALNGLFTLITEHNLDYPDFYTKLYALFDKNLFHVKYRSRFLRLVDLFLSSSLLPSYLVAAFIKRMARLSLSAPPAAIVAIIPLIYNILKRHPACLVLIHREQDPDTPITEFQDPYLQDEKNPSKSRALESSLWELQTLKNHYLHTISGMVRVFEEPIAKQSVYDLEDFLDHTYTSLFESETKKKSTDTAPPIATYTKTVGIFESVSSNAADTSIFSI